MNLCRERDKMEQQICETIDCLVEAIYRLELKKIDNTFVQLLDELGEYIGQRTSGVWDTLLLNIQDSYVRKDYVRFADILLYELKPLLTSN